MTEEERRAALYLAGQVHAILAAAGIRPRAVNLSGPIPSLTVPGIDSTEVTLTFTAQDDRF